jgi:hypothetical protein
MNIIITIFCAQVKMRKAKKKEIFVFCTLFYRYLKLIFFTELITEILSD